tara:strand:+ start:20 stop:844 length:825 start_codon:yes stop_codon:yes gene_type:complete
MAYASGKFSKAQCDRCGFVYDYPELKTEWNGLKTCPTCYEIKHPQLDPIRHVIDPEALREPRPDNDKEVGLGKVVTTSDPIGRILSSFQIASSVGTLSVLENDNTVSQTLDSQLITAYLGTITVSGNITESVSVTGQAGTSALGSPYVTNALQTFTVTVVGGNPSNHPYYNFGSSNKFAINGSTATADVTLSLNEGETYKFDQSDSSNSGHPLRFSTTANGTHGGGSEYTTGVTTNGTPGSSGAYTQITVASGAPTLYYYCSNHSGMGWTANTI